MKKEVMFCIFILIFLLIPMISAINTEIKIKTFPNHEVQVTPYKGSSYSKPLKNDSDEYGDASFIFSSDMHEFNLIVYVKKDGETVHTRKYYEELFYAGELISLKLPEKGFDFIETPGEINDSQNEEINNSQNMTVVENKTGAKITGSAIFGEGGVFSNNTTYYVGGIIILFVVGAFVLFKLKNKSKIPKEIKIKKLSELQNEKKEELQDNKEIIEDAEKKIKEAQEDIRKIKNEDKISEAEKKIREDEEALTRLREGRE